MLPSRHDPSKTVRVPPRAPVNVWLQRAMWVIVLGLGVYLLIPRLASVSEALRLLPQARPGPLWLALLFQAVTLLAHAAVVCQVLSHAGLRPTYWRVLEVILAAGLAVLLLPSLGISGLFIRGRYLDEDGISLDTSVLTLSLESMGQGLGHCILLVPALLQQLSSGQQGPLRPALLLMGMVLAANAGLGYLLSQPRSRDWRYGLLRWINRALVGLQRPTVAASRLQERLAVLRQALPLHGWSQGLPWLLANTARVLGGALCLYFVLVAFGQRLPLHTVFIAFSLAEVLGCISTVPNGLVVTETTLSALLAQAGAPLAPVMAAVLLFRMLSLWLPRALGIPAWIHLQRSSPRPLRER